MNKKFNLIWIMTDQQPGYMLSCNGDPNVRTPNIDLLSEFGVNFENAVGNPKFRQKINYIGC